MSGRQMVRYGVTIMFLAGLGFVVELWTWAVRGFVREIGWAWMMTNVFVFIIGACVTLSGDAKKQAGQ